MKSLIQTQQESVTLRHYDSTIDEYGQKHTSYTEREVSMYLTKYNQTIESDVRFNDVVYIGITQDNTITDEDNILYKGKEYKVTHTIDAVGPIKWNQVFLSIYEN